MTTARRLPPQPLRRIFAIPLALTIASLVGLVLGLTGDGWRDVFASALLFLPLAVVVHYWRRRGSLPS